MASTSFEGRERETWAKAPSHVLRLAGVLAYLDWAGGLRGNNFAVGPEPREIEARFISAAADLWHGYLWPHARAAIRQIGLNDTARRTAAHPALGSGDGRCRAVVP